MEQRREAEPPSPGPQPSPRAAHLGWATEWTKRGDGEEGGPSTHYAGSQAGGRKISLSPDSESLGSGA